MDPAIADGLLLWVILCVSIALHEYGHAKSADLMGDDLPRSQGRVTLDPINHLDPIGTGLIPLIQILGPLMGASLPIALIGWGRPVAVNVDNFPRGKRMTCHLLSVAAGPAVNLLLCLVAALIIGLWAPFAPVMMKLGTTLLYMNALLIAFNMIPIPPLDGSHFLRYAIGMSQETFMRLSLYGAIVLFIAINLPPFQIFLWALIKAIVLPFAQLAYLLQGWVT